MKINMMMLKKPSEKNILNLNLKRKHRDGVKNLINNLIIEKGQKEKSEKTSITDFSCIFIIDKL